MPTLTKIQVVNAPPTGKAIQADFSDSYRVLSSIQSPYGLDEVARALDYLARHAYVYGQHLKNRPEKEPPC